MPSTQTRSKLKAFQFIEGAPSTDTRKEREAEKENGHIDPRRKETPKTSRTVKNVEQSTTETPKLVHAKTCPPSTPATRLPLADLVGNVDDSSRHLARPIVSPEEQLGWRGSQPVNTPIPRKNRKRARSSSPPAGASQEDTRIESLRQELTTPQPDPATELWARYASNKGTPGGNKAIAFAHLISNESSPRSSATAGSVSGLRRWASCGVEFPASHTKKRRTKGAFRVVEIEPAEDVFGAASLEAVFQGQPEKSRLADMIQRMQDSIAPTKPCLSEIPSSSSPLPEARDRHIPLPSSPLRHHAQDDDAESPQTLGPGTDAVEEEDVSVEPTHLSSSSDEFGDVDFDAEMVDALEISQRAPEQPNSPAFMPAQPVDSAHLQTTVQPIALAADDDSDDEFGIDEESFAADLEQVASLYDVTSEETPVNQFLPINGAGDDTIGHSAAPPVIDLVDDDDDEFGDDIDADEFAAAEIAATQSYSTNVRRLQTYP